MRIRNHRRGMALVLSFFALAIFSSLAVALASMAVGNVQAADNQKKGSRAFYCAESGLEVTRYWLSQIMMPSSIPPQDYYWNVVVYLQNELKDDGITNFVMQNDGTIPAVTLNTTTNESFSVALKPHAGDLSVIDVFITGTCGTISRTVGVQFNVVAYEHPIFNFGMATKGPISFANNPTTTGVTENWEADIYTESSSSAIAFQVGGNTNFAGDIQIANPLANVDFAGAINIAGDIGADAIANHVEIGVPPVDFPAPDTARFTKYATGPVLDGSFDLTKGITLTNVTIPAGMNPTFDGTVTIEGVLIIESPNVINFGSNVAVQGVIVGQGDISSPTDQINVAGNFATYPYPADSAFDGIRNEIGTSVLAPGFSASFTGNYSSIEGVIATSGLNFSGNANATLKGSVINYSDTPTTVSGNVVMNFDRASSTKIPAGFDTDRVLAYNGSSYSIVQ